MNGIDVREKIVELSVGILRGVAERTGRGVHVVPWDGESELERPWCCVHVPEFRSMGAGSDAWEVGLMVQLATAKGSPVEAGEVSGYVDAIVSGLGEAAAEWDVGVSDVVVEDQEAVVDGKGRVLEVEFSFIAAV